MGAVVSSLFARKGMRDRQTREEHETINIHSRSNGVAAMLQESRRRFRQSKMAKLFSLSEVISSRISFFFRPHRVHFLDYFSAYTCTYREASGPDLKTRWSALTVPTIVNR